MSGYKKISVGIMDLGINNIFSIFQLFKNLGYNTEIYKSKNKFRYNFVVIPGVGTFEEGMKSLKKNKFDKDIYEIYKKKKNFIIGICLGMQLLFEESNEFKKTIGLGLIKGSVKMIPKKSNIKTHIGWKKIKLINKKFINISDKFLYYFVHSYLCEVKNKKDILCKSKLGKLDFASGIRKNNLIGLQFHPEKSGHHGIKLINQILMNLIKNK